MKRIGWLLSFCAVLLIALFVNGFFFMSGLENRSPISTPPFIEKEPNKYTEQLSVHIESSDSKEMPVNLMVLGLDRDKTRCDVIMLFHFVPSTSSLSLISVARDTRVLADGVYTRINTLYSKGGEKMVAEELTKITKFPVHYYITVDFKGFREIIDALDGVEFDVPFRMNYDDPTQNLHIHLKKGLQVLNGKKAEQLVRYRKGNYKGQGYTEGDLGRISMQQDFMRALIKQKLNIRYLPKSQKIFSILQQYVKTNITLADITQYIGSVAKIEDDEIKTFTIPGTSKMISGKWYFIYDKDETAEMMKEHF